MSSLRYRTLLSYLPGMATVVNAFQSPDVQKSVYDTLMKTLEAKLEAEGMAPADAPKSADAATVPSRKPRKPVDVDETEIAHDLVEGDSIHTELNRSSAPASTVF